MAEKKKGIFYDAASNFFNLKTAGDQEQVFSCLKTLKNFVIRSPSPQAGRLGEIQSSKTGTDNNFQSGDNKRRARAAYAGTSSSQSPLRNSAQAALKREGGAKVLTAPLKFCAAQLLDLSDQNVQQATKNLGISEEELTREIQITDFYDIKESSEMQLRRYLTQINQTNLKIKAILAEKARLERDKAFLQNQKQLLLHKVLAPAPHASGELKQPQYKRPYASDEQIQAGHYRKRLSEENNKEKRETDRILRHIVASELQQEALQQRQSKEAQQVQKVVTSQSLLRASRSGERAQYYAERREARQEIQKERESESIKNLQSHTDSQVALVEKNQQRAALAESIKYERDQRTQEERARSAEAALRHEEEQKRVRDALARQVEEDMAQAEKRRLEQLAQESSRRAQIHSQKNHQKYLWEEKLAEENQIQVQKLGVKFARQANSVERARRQREGDLKKIADARDTRQRETSERFFETLNAHSNIMQEKHLIQQKRTMQSAAYKAEHTAIATTHASVKQMEKLIQTQATMKQLRAEREEKHNKLLQEELERRQIIEKEKSEYHQFQSKKSLEKIKQRKLREQLVEELQNVALPPTQLHNFAQTRYAELSGGDTLEDDIPLQQSVPTSASPQAHQKRRQNNDSKVAAGGGASSNNTQSIQNDTQNQLTINDSQRQNPEILVRMQTKITDSGAHEMLAQGVH